MNTTRKWLSPLRWLLNAWLQFRIGMARRRNALLAIDKLETQTQLLHSPLQKYNVNQLKKLAIRHKREGRPQVAEGCKAEIKRRIYVGQHRDEIFVSPKAAKAAAVAAFLVFSFQCSVFSANAEPKGGVGTDVPWAVTSQWLWGLVGALVIFNLALGVIYGCKKVFGKKPPIQEELVGIHKKIYAVGKTVDERFRDLQIERQRTLADLYEKINRVAEDVAYMRGKISNE